MSPPWDARERAPAWAQLRLGTILLALLVAASTAVFFLERLERQLSEGPHLTVEASSARGLEVGSDVWIAGVAAGRVEAIRLLRPHDGHGPVIIRAVLRPGAGRVLRADATASLRASALMAPTVLALEPGREADRPFAFGDTLQALPELSLDQVMARADTLRARLHRLEPDGRALARRLDEGPGTLASLRRHPERLRRLAADLERSRQLALTAPGGTAARILRDVALRREAHRLRVRLATMTAPGGALARASRERTAMRATLDSLRRRGHLLETRLAEGSGTAGRVLHDRAIQRERALFRARMDSVKAELIADPLRWLRFALF